MSIPIIRLIEARTEEIKKLTRDKREPKRQDKMNFQRDLIRLTQRKLRRDMQKARVYIESQIKSDLDFDDVDLLEEFFSIFKRMALGGAGIVLEGIGIDLDYTGINDKALSWAKKYVGEFIKGINETTRDIVKQAISTFIEIPGTTIGDIMDKISYAFNESRAMTIAVTEVTTAYAQGQKIIGQELKEQFPDVPIVKQWFTNEDELVCDICFPLGEMDPIPFDDDWPGGIDAPPAHVNCRCWQSVTTNIEAANG